MTKTATRNDKTTPNDNGNGNGNDNDNTPETPIKTR